MNAPGTGGESRRSAPLDLLRAVAVLLVLGRHAEQPPANSWAVTRLGMGAWKWCGWAGVDLFFVLSGFLVSGLLFKEYRRCGSVRVGRFFVRRAFKIYPAFYAFLATLVVVHFLEESGLTPRWLHLYWSRLHVLGDAVFLQNYLGSLQAHTWSLAVEEHFYIGVGLLTLALVRRAPRSPDFATNPFKPIVPVTAAVVVACLGLRIATEVVRPWRNPTDFLTYVTPTHLRVDSLMFGVLLAYAYHFHGEAVRRWAGRAPVRVLIGCLALVVAGVALRLQHPFTHTVGFTCLYVGFGGIVVLSVTWPPFEQLNVRWLSVIGVYSYSIYLWHLVVQSLTLATLTAVPWGVRCVAYFVLSVVLGVVAARLVEVPALKLRDRLFPRAVAAPIS